MTLHAHPISAIRTALHHPGAGQADRAALIHHDLLNAILEQRLLPGTKLGEDELGNIYGASRTIVRQALQSLAHEGIIETAKNRGAFVAQPTPSDAHEVFDARKLVEARIAQLAAARHAEDHAAGRAELLAHLASEREAVRLGQDHQAIRLSGEFHLLIAGHAGHLVYANMLRELVARSSLIILLYRTRTAPVCCTDHHDHIADAIMAGRAERAATLMVEHLDEIERALDVTQKHIPPSALSDILGSRLAG
jgi:DNA-binding GntR family transcriptional regulator